LIFNYLNRNYGFQKRDGLIAVMRGSNGGEGDSGGRKLQAMQSEK
jgi:hypothetical protein